MRLRKTWWVGVPAVFAAALLSWCVPVLAVETGAPQAPARVIVKYKADAAAGARPAFDARSIAAARPEARMARLGTRTGLALTRGSTIAERTHVVSAPGLSAQALAERLSRDSDVAYAVPDQVRRAQAAPNDPLYPNRLTSSTPDGSSGQWYLQAPQGALQANVHVEPAWDLARDRARQVIVVAVLDTGVNLNHPDLKGVSADSGLLPGYDMIVDDARAADAQPGDPAPQPGRDPSPADPGDGLTEADLAPGGAFSRCDDGPSDSSWHGTQTAGLIGALTDNGIGMASVGRQHVRVLPVRVLGKCGGQDSDIIAGMRWAAGLHVDGVPDNPHPARVINLSLGGEGACTRAYVDAINEVSAAGALVVASAGNIGHAVSAPANCPGVVAVAGLQHTGAKVGYSDLGPEVALSAPAGNCVNDSGRCLYPIVSTSNDGAIGPGADSYTNDTTHFAVGTSFSAPLVAGTAALMLSINPDLTPRQLRLLLQSSARPFPTSGAVVGTGDPAPQQCTSPRYDSDGAALTQLQCYCSTGTCGAGMLDVAAAVLAAAQATPVFKARARIDLLPVAPTAGAPLRLSAANSVVETGRGIVSHRWTLMDSGSIVGALVNPTAPEITVMPTAAGRFTVVLTVQDDAGTSSSTTLTVDVAAAAAVASSPAGGGGGGGGGATGMPWQLGLLCGTAALLVLRRRPRLGTR